MAAKKKGKVLKVEKKKPLTKKEQLALIANNVGISAKQAQEVFEQYEELLKAELDRIQEFKFMDLGKIKITQSKARMGRNPLTGKEVKIEAKTKLKFVFAKKYKEFANTLFE